MAHKRYKSAAAAELLQQEAGMHFYNPFTKKIYLKMFTKHIHKKDENADLELSWNHFEDSSMSDACVLRQFNDFSTDADDENSTDDEMKPVGKK